MFISRKDFEQAIENAKRKGAEKAERELRMHERFDRLEEHMWKRMSELEDRINQLQFEKNYGFEPAEKCSCPPPKSC